MGSYPTMNNWENGWDDDANDILLQWNNAEVRIKRQALLTLSNHMHKTFASYPEESIYVISERTWKNPPPSLPGIILPAIEHYCSRKFDPEFTEPYECLALHAFAELFDCPKLLEWSAFALESEWHRVCSNKSDEDLFSDLDASYRPFIAARLPLTSKVVRSNVRGECVRRLERLDETGRYEEALRRMRAVPWAMADMFHHIAKDSSPSIPEYEWKCDSCGAEFVYTKTPERTDFGLPSCPCCAVPGEALGTMRVATPPIPIRRQSGQVNAAETSSSKPIH